MFPCFCSEIDYRRHQNMENIAAKLACDSCATFFFVVFLFCFVLFCFFFQLVLPHFDVSFDLLLNKCTATWNLFVKSFLVKTCIATSLWSL